MQKYQMPKSTKKNEMLKMRNIQIPSAKSGIRRKSQMIKYNAKSAK